MAVCKQLVGVVITLVILVNIGVIFADVSTQVQDNDRQAVTPGPTTATKTNVSEHTSNSSSNAINQTTVPSRLPNNASNQTDDSSGSTKPKNNDADISTQNPGDNPGDNPDTTEETTQANPKDTTQNPNTNKATTQAPAESIPSKMPGQVTQNTTQSKSLTSTDSDSSKNITQDKKDETTVRSYVTTEFLPLFFDTTWMDTFIHTHHFEGQYMFNGARYLFDFVVRYKHQNDPKTLVTNFYDADGAVLEFNGTCTDGHQIVFTLSKIYTPGVRFPLKEPLEVTGSFPQANQPYFTGNFTKPINSSFSWFHMNKGLGAIETGETAGTRTVIVIIIPTSIAFLGICGTVAIICWASKKGYLRGRHKSYRLFTNAQVSYESEAETIHI